MLDLKSFKQFQLDDDYSISVVGGRLTQNASDGRPDDIDDKGITRYSPGDKGKKDDVI